MDTLTEIVRQEVSAYASNGRGANILLFPLLDDDNATYAVNAVDYPTRHDVALVIVLVRIVGDVVVIEEDSTDKKLVDAPATTGNISRKNCPCLSWRTTPRCRKI